MPKPTGLPSLNLAAAKQGDGSTLHPLSPQSLASPRSPRSIPTSPLVQSPGSQQTMRPIQARQANENGNQGHSPASPQIAATPGLPASPDRDTGRHEREPSRSFFSNLLASKSSHRLHSPEPTIVESEKSGGRSQGESRDRPNYELRTKGSKSDLSRLPNTNGKPSSEYQDEGRNHLVPPGSADGSSISQKKSRSKLGGILNRTKVMRVEDESKRKTSSPVQLSLDSTSSHTGRVDMVGQALKTAPIKSDRRERAFAEADDTAPRTRSADRGREDMIARKPGTSSSGMAPSSLKESTMFSGIQNTGKGVSERWGKAGKGLLSKITRSGSSTEREIPTEENYICNTIILPLVEQTRKTRIAKRLELSRDKTEFWMPALPWRCIDYLNMNGCEEEGLYRIPGSGREVKVWQKRFDTEYDINLFEEPDLYDINTIGSLFKSWLRELPDEILPKVTQAKIARECAGAVSTPQVLKDELSKLPPFNYYLLFAITCHLSLLHSFADKNKMDYRNLCICFQPCLKIDAFCFQFLVINWKECWQGCWTEQEYLQEEYRWEKEGSIFSRKAASVDERAVSTSGSNQPPPPFSQQLRGAESNGQRKNSLSSTSGAFEKHRNPSVASTAVYGNSSVMSSVPPPRMVTPEAPKIPEPELPELGSLSPIRM